MNTVVVKIFPEDYAADDALQKVRDTLSVPEKKDKLIAALKAVGVKALIITPEYNIARQEDVGTELVFHVLYKEKIIDVLLLSKLSGEIEEILGIKGIALLFDQENIPELTRYFGGENKNNLVAQILKKLENN